MLLVEIVRRFQSYLTGVNVENDGGRGERLQDAASLVFTVREYIKYNSQVATAPIQQLLLTSELQTLGTNANGLK